MRVIAEEKSAHLRALSLKCGEGNPGSIFWANPTRAMKLLDTRLAELVNAGPVAEKVGILLRSAGWPLDRFSTISRDWEGKTAVLIGGGPSLTTEQVERVRVTHEAGKVRVIAINDAYRLAPWADICYFADSEWWRWHKDRPEFQAFQGQKCSIQNSGGNVEDAAVHLLRNRGADGLSSDPAGLATGRHGGYQALNLAMLAGAKTIILLGYDGKLGDRGKTHWFGDHRRIEPQTVFEMYRQSFSQAENAIKAAGVTVRNCSPGSAITAFERGELANCL